MSGVPYSDNLYSALDDSDDDNQDALSPADGYFHASTSSEAASSSQAYPQSQSHSHFHAESQSHLPGRGSAGVPSVPNVLVEDPTLREQDATAKAREAEEERRFNSLEHSSAHFPHPQTSSSYHHYQYRPSGPVHHHRRSVEDDVHDSVFRDQSSHYSPPPAVASPGDSRPHPQIQTHNSPPHSRSQSQFHPTPSDAPPAYSPRSPTSSSSPSSGGAGTYQTFGQATVPQSDMGNLADEQQRLLPREPESMGGAPSGRHLSWWERMKQRSYTGPARKKAKSILGVLLVISIFVIIFSSVTIKHSPSDDQDNDGDYKPPGTIKDPDPIRGPDNRIGNEIEWEHYDRCLNEPHHFPIITSHLDFNPDKPFIFVEKTDEHDRGSGRPPYVTGSVLIRPTDNDKSAGRVEFQMLSNSRDLTVEAKWNPDEQTFIVRVPRQVPWDAEGVRPCLQIRLDLWVPRMAILKSLSVEATHLDINIVEGLYLIIEENMLLETVAGVVAAPEMRGDGALLPYITASREIHIKTVSGDITGWYPLYDLLEMKSASGNVRTDVAPKSQYDKSPKAAHLNVTTISGDIKLKEPLTNSVVKHIKNAIPPRDYVAHIDSSSGDISADLAVTSEGSFTSTSGNVNVQLLPVLDSSLIKAGISKPKIVTDTKSGDHKVNIWEPLWTKIEGYGQGPNGEPIQTPGHSDDSDSNHKDNDGPFLIIHPHVASDSGSSLDGDTPLTSSVISTNEEETPPFSVLSSEHTSISGNIDLLYPESWTGTLKAQTLSGNQRFEGKDLHVSKMGGSFPRLLEGYKGAGKSKLKVETVSGGQQFFVGKK